MTAKVEANPVFPMIKSFQAKASSVIEMTSNAAKTVFRLAAHPSVVYFVTGSLLLSQATGTSFSRSLLSNLASHGVALSATILYINFLQARTKSADVTAVLQKTKPRSPDHPG